MADVNSDQYQKYAVQNTEVVEPYELGGRVRTAVATASVDSNLSTDDVIKLMWLPKHAVLLDMQVVSDSGVGGMTDEDVGDANDVDGLFDGIDISTGPANLQLEEGDGAVGLEDLGVTELWEALGYSTKKDAPQQIEVLMTTSGASGSGTLAVRAMYAVD